MILAFAYGIHVAACGPYQTSFDPRLARPFGTPHDMPPHYWRVSSDMLQSLHTASSSGLDPNPKTTYGEVRLLYGWPVLVDPDATVGTISLEPVL